MNINEEGKYYASMVRKYRSEYSGRDLTRFCREQKVSYTKMLHCLRNDSYRRMESPIDESIDNTAEVDNQEEIGLHPLVIDGQDEVKEATEDMPKSVSSKRESWLGNVDIMFGKIRVRIGRCSKSDLVSLIKEMEETVC